ncbi:MAG TPA: hypothetical protein VK886_01275 [Vicinamibacterales bacterium]|nr:hypothetical protein [Vicinamibacterales bacterium]
MRLHSLIALAAGAASLAAIQSMPSELSALVAAASLQGRVVAWCGGEFRVGRPGSYALAVESASGGGRYLVIESNAALAELAPYSDEPEVSCYSPAVARKLDATIAVSETIEGGIRPIWKTTVICAFVENTRAVCWQYSPARRTFVKVGGWIT